MLCFAKEDKYLAVRIVDYRVCGISLHNIALRGGQNPSTALLIYYEWIAEDNTERHGGSPYPIMTNAQDNRQKLRLNLQIRTTTSLFVKI
ncbi:hypothetical protein TNCV_1709351 [Trichonephila clavipes]|nr:hypothetical protein TNCV_1709351 [Trichonephila clavipes]